MGHDVAVDLGRRRLRRFISISAYKRRAKRIVFARRPSAPHSPEQDPVIVISEAELEAARNNQAARKLVKRALEEEQQMEREGRIRP